VNPVERALRRIAQDLQGTGRSWALVGGLAVSARAEPRTTRDVDLAVAVSGDREAESLVFRLQTLGYSVLAVLEQGATGRLATVRFRPPQEKEGGVLVDLLFASSGIEPEIVSAAEDLDILPNLRVPVARLSHLCGWLRNHHSGVTAVLHTLEGLARAPRALAAVNTVAGGGRCARSAAFFLRSGPEALLLSWIGHRLNGRTQVAARTLRPGLP
jgi:hypothetical protein